MWLHYVGGALRSNNFGDLEVEDIIGVSKGFSDKVKKNKILFSFFFILDVLREKKKFLLKSELFYQGSFSQEVIHPSSSEGWITSWDHVSLLHFFLPTNSKILNLLKLGSKTQRS